MKKLILIMFAAAFAAVGCNKFEGDTSDVQGAPATLRVKVNGIQMTSRAMMTAGSDDALLESGLKNLTLFVFDSSDAKVAEKYAVLTDNEGEDVELSFAIPATSEYVVAIANRGDLTGTSITSFADVADLTYDVASTASFGELPQSGQSDIVEVSTTTYQATIQLEYIPARISVENVTLFGANVISLDETSSDATAVAAMQAQHITSISLTSVFVLNVPNQTYLHTGVATDLFAGAATGFGYYAGADVDGVVSGTYYPAVAPSENTTLSAGPFSEPISTATSFPYFYVTENKPTGDAGKTLVVFKCEVKLTTDAIDGQPHLQYYTVVLDGSKVVATNGYSVKRRYHYHITADLTSRGTENPYTPTVVPTGFFTIKPSTWLEGGDYNEPLPQE